MHTREDLSAIHVVPRGSPTDAEPESEPTASHTDHRELSPTLRVLQKSLFSGLSGDELRQLAGQARLKPYPKGAFIVRAGQAGDSLSIISEGVVEVMLEHQGGRSVRLGELGPGQHFGEMSVFDGQPRSATVVALTQCEILELERTVARPYLTHQAVIPKVLSGLATRLRDTSSAVRDLSEQVYRAAYANVHAAVSVELDTIKLLYRRTEHRAADVLQKAQRRSTQVLDRAERQASDVLQQAQQSADKALARANDVAAGVETRVQSALALLKKRVMPIAAVVAAVATALGVNSFLDLKEKFDEASEMHAEMAGFQGRMREADRALSIVQETMTDLRSAREAAALDRTLETPAELRRAALSYEAAKDELMRRYLDTRGAERRYAKFEPEVVFEALDTYVALSLRERPDGRLVLPGRERRALIDALAHVVGRLRDDRGEQRSGQAGWLLDHKLRDLAWVLGESADKEDAEHLRAALSEIAGRRDGRRSRENAALILASLEYADDAVRGVLTGMMDQGPWRAAKATVSLAKLGDARAYHRLDEQLEDDETAYAFASLLAREGKQALEGLARRYDDSAAWPARAKRIRHILRAHEPRNCLEQRHDRWLLACLAGSCGRGDPTQPIGGACTLSEI